VTLDSIPSELSPSELRKLASDHNWNDGFALPWSIADHVNCDLMVALELFWLSEAAEVYLGEALEDSYNSDWHSFSRTLANRILEGRFAKGTSKFQAHLTKVQVSSYRKKGLPSVFLAFD
jgi:hypothetical protein